MDKYERFEQWLRENGARFELLELREYDCGTPTSSGNNNSNLSSMEDELDEEKKEPGSSVTAMGTGNNSNTGPSPSPLEPSSSEMRGVHAVTHIPPNTVLMSIPRRCLITVEMGQATPIGQAVLHSDLDLDAPKHIFLMIYILWDRAVNGQQSFFAPYYDILPTTLSNMPIFWTPAELAELEGSFLLQQIADRHQAIADDYHAICQVAPLDRICTLEEFKWARMCVCSRNFGLSVDGHRTSAMVPHADMLNHYRPRETKWTFDEDRQAFTITSLQHVPAGAQVYDSYGQKCNHRFLLNYGFAVEHNRELDDFCPNEVPLELYVDPDDSLFSEKLDFWTRGEQTTPGHATTVPTASTPAARAAASRELQQQQRYNRSGLVHRNQQHSTKQQTATNNKNNGTPVIKRVRVCVSNNENTRLLFSLLRSLVCNAQELEAIRTASGANSNGGAGPDHDNNVTRALFGFPSSETTTRGGGPSRTSSNNATTGLNFMVPTAATAPEVGHPSISYHPVHQYRSCRDVRHPISLRNERAAMQLMLTVIRRHLSLYPTTLAQDVNDLLDERTYPRFSNRRHAKIQVRGEKQVLHHFATWAQMALHVLDILEAELLQHQDVSHGSNNSVEVKLTPGGGHMVTASSGAEEASQQLPPHESHTPPQPPSFDQAIRQLEEDEQVHHTILRYCSDVLGSLRREEFKHLRRQQRGAPILQQPMNGTSYSSQTQRYINRHSSEATKSPLGWSSGSRRSGGGGRGGYL